MRQVYAYPYFIGQPVTIGTPQGPKWGMVRAFNDQDDSADVELSDSVSHTITVQLTSLKADRRTSADQRFTQLLTSWKKLLLGRDSVHGFDEFFVRCIWTYINHLAFKNQMGEPTFVVGDLGKGMSGFYKPGASPGKGRLLLDSDTPFTIGGLASVVAHEMIHQWQDKHGEPKDGTDWHGPSFLSVIARVESATGIKIKVEAQGADDSDFFFQLHTGTKPMRQVKSSSLVETDATTIKVGLLAPDNDPAAPKSDTNDKVNDEFALASEVTALSRQEVEASRAQYGAFLKIMIAFSITNIKDFPQSLIKYVKSPVLKAKALEFMKKWTFSPGALRALSKGITNFSGDMEDIYDKIEDDSYLIAEELKARIPEIAKDTSIPREIVTLMASTSRFLRVASESSAAQVENGVRYLNDPELSSYFVEKKVEKSGTAKTEVLRLAKAITGKPSLFLSLDEIAVAEAKKPKLYAQYQEAYKKLKGLSKTRMQQLIRGSGKPLIDCEAVSKKMEAEGFLRMFQPGFKGLVDEAGGIYTMAGHKIQGTASNPHATIIMNPKYDPEGPDAHKIYVFRAVTAKGVNNYYTEEHWQQANTVKHEKVDVLRSKIEAIRKKWGAALRTEGPNQALALVLETDYQTIARIGTLGNKTDGKETYGLTTLLCKNVVVTGNSIKFQYKGKAGEKQVHAMSGTDTISRVAVKLLISLKKRGEPNDHIFRQESGSRVTAGAANAYFRKLGSPVTIHKLRTMKGTMLAEVALAKNPFAGKKDNDEPTVTEYLKKKLTPVGKALGHFAKGVTTPMTAIKSYIAPSLIRKFYEDAGVRPPSTIEKMLLNSEKLT